MTDEEIAEAKEALAIFHATAAAAMHTLQGMFNEPSQLGLVITFPESPTEPMFFGMMDIPDAIASLTHLNSVPHDEIAIVDPNGRMVMPNEVN